ncbi:MAG TPA: SpoIIE family protein phosphatase [Streptosporangiaceae bacterium]
MTPGPPGAGAGGGETGQWLGTRLDLTDIAGLLLDIAVPRYGDGGAVFVLERLVAGQADPGSQLVVRRLANRFVGSDGELGRAAMPPGELLAFTADSRYGRLLTGSGPQRFGELDQAVLERIRPGGRQVLGRHTSFLAVPMIAQGAVVGALVVSRTGRAEPYTDAETAALADLAVRAGASVADAAEFARRRRDGEALRRGLAPAEPPVPDHVEVAWRSLPAPGRLVGGDWWDIVALPGGRTGLVVGDVMGHGLTAAMLLAQLRAAAHTLADLDLEPAELMGRLDRSAAALPGGTCATCVYAVVDPAEGSCTMSLAGHLSPVLALPDGRTHVPALPAGLPVGLGTGQFGQARIKLAPGAVLALYTDGLVESRTRSFTKGVLALRSAISGEHGDLAGTCDTLIESLRHQEDDVTVLLARIPPGGPG